ncbi:hypothetical protein [Pseudofrankia asymbiotica]|uniref:WXG100 family type VII secretion target n=1 Tax=Pseudofrankia asymbiotica TaxID=1834516 RepID=A0A1V2IKQ2_9ACTN|nr:hypothetical protein [Pseudofrankia asymbiotica]ONH33782.1 hypothetical protein BL253_00095 [Pseudofrankia asymbiotica]
MANINVDYEQVNSVASLLNSAVTQTVPKLNGLKNEVTTLLTSDGGLWLQQSSPVLSRQYTDFNTSVTGAVNNITSFASQFNAIVTQLQTMDAAIAGSK